jgi:PAS domain S-box-containing protein
MMTAQRTQKAETALELTNEGLRLALVSSRTLAWDWDIKSGREHLFGDLKTILGIEADGYDAHIDDVRSSIHPDDIEAATNAMVGARDSRAPYSAEFRILWPDGTVKWLKATGQFYYSADGQPQRMLGMATDITERKRVEQALRQREKELLEAQRVAHVGSWMWDPETDNINWSEESYRIAGRDPGLPPLTFRQLRQLCTPHSWELLQRTVEEALQSGTPYELDLELLRPGGTKKWIRTRGEAQRDSTGRIALLRGTVQDITERKNAEEALRESEARFRNVFQDAGVGMIIASLDGCFLAVNRTFCEYLGYTEEEMIRMTVEEVTQPEDWPLFSAKLEEAIATGTSFQRFEKRCRHKSGCTVYTESSALLIKSPDGKPQYFVGEVLTVTERKMAEQSLADANRRLIDAQEEERARIARDLHDDINQRLALLAVELQSLKQYPPRSETELQQKIDEASKQIEDLSTDIQTLAHGLHPPKLELLGLSAAAASLCREVSDRQKVKIEFRSQDVPNDLSTEHSLCLFRVLQEALQNAIKHSGSRNLQVSFTGRTSEIELTVCDSGVGFDPEEAMKKGRGLGLTSIRERLKLVNGILSIDSQPQRGTTIHALVPLSSGVKSVTASAWSHNLNVDHTTKDPTLLRSNELAL